jgi:hypothetical protein
MPTSQPAPRSTTTPPAPLSQLVGIPPCDADHVLLGCFGLDLGGTRTRHDLCTAARGRLPGRARPPRRADQPATD